LPTSFSITFGLQSSLLLNLSLTQPSLKVIRIKK
jgi:hypothetical protein